MPDLKSIKHAFFTNSPIKKAEFSFKDYEFNLNLFNTEFSSLYELFLSNKHQLENNKELLLFLDYLCTVLIQYYHLDYVQKDLELLEKRKKEIDIILKRKIPKKVKHQTKSHPYLSASKIRAQVSFLNTNRTYWNYSRALANQILSYLKFIGFFTLMDEFNKKIGWGMNPDNFNKLLDSTLNTLRVLSVGLFALHLAINLAIMAKHVLYAMLKPELSSLKVLKQELDKRSFILTNDLTWATVNLLTNYGKLLHLSTKYTGALSSYFLIFDLVLLSAQGTYEMAKYNSQLSDLREQRDNATTALEYSLIDRQIDIVQDEKNAVFAYYAINVFAAALFVASFAATFLFTSLLILLLLATINMIANALYNTSEDFKKYQSARIALRRENKNGELQDNAHHRALVHSLNKEYIKASNIFWQNLIFNASATALIITVAAVYWPAAAALIIAYTCYKIMSSLKTTDAQQSENKDIYRIMDTECLQFRFS